MDKRRPGRSNSSKSRTGPKNGLVDGGPVRQTESRKQSRSENSVRSPRQLAMAAFISFHRRTRHEHKHCPHEYPTKVKGPNIPHHTIVKSVTKQNVHRIKFGNVYLCHSFLIYFIFFNIINADE